MDSGYDISFISSISDIEPSTWDKTVGNSYPFLRHAFLLALETTGCTNKQSGWEPHHLIVKTDGKLSGLMPLYIKHDSYGEYVFDWSWADAYHRHGIDYYPKLLCAIPYTPATGPRLCLNEKLSSENIVPHIAAALKSECEKINASSFHCLFPFLNLHNTLIDENISARQGCQFHWLNNNYSSFDEFLSTFTSRKRKNLKKERQKVAEQNIEILVKEGAEISEEEWQQFYVFYHLTYYKRSGRQGYLNQAFFLALASSMADSIIMVQAKHEGAFVAASLFFKGDDTLYGRYWGCDKEFDMLHFECCYYQGIEYAIKHNLKRFDPGAQGEHKIQRGFTPVPTYSNHWIVREDFRSAINDFLEKEKEANQHYIDDAKTYLPFKEN